MSTTEVRFTTSEALAVITDALDRLDPDRSRLGPADRLSCAKLARALSGRMESLAALLLAEADRADASLRAAGTPTTSWLGVDERLSRREAAGALHRAQELAAHPAVGAAATAGRIGGGQARVITRMLNALAPQLDAAQQAAAEEVLVGLAGTLDADELAKAAPRVLAEVAPHTADELVETRLQREAEAAWRDRSLRFFRQGGSVRFDGSLPRVEAEEWITLLDAHAESQRRTLIEERDPLAESLTPQQRRADALVAMISGHRVNREAPRSGGDRPRVVVTVDFDRLRRLAAGAGLVADGQPVSAGELRRMCCDAGILPVVLGGPSEVLDVGREHRLVTPAIRAALVVRDRGCAFPGCETRPSACEAHHIVPWWAGGSTALGNLALLCHHHHGLVEPARYGMRDQWQIRIGADGVPEAIPPTRYRAGRTPIRHQRYPSPTAA